MSKPIVAILGRPNVGKSTLFNRLAGRRLAIVEDTPGVTRDRLYAAVEWRGRPFTLVDTGGFQTEEEDLIVTSTRRQAEIAASEADVIVFLTDGRQGLLGADQDVAQFLRRQHKPVVVAVNKVEHDLGAAAAMEFYGLGLGEPVAISALHGMGIGDLLDRVVAAFPPADTGDEAQESLGIAIVGRPNVGKSSLVNAWVGEERVIVSDVPGTTRDAVDTPFTWKGRRMLLIDTAGIRRQSRVRESLEYYSVLRAMRAVERAQAVVSLLDASVGITEQDKRIIGLGHEAGKAQVVAFNKWDQVEKGRRDRASWERAVHSELPFLDYAPVHCISVRNGQGLESLMEAVWQSAQANALQVPDKALREVMEDAVVRQPPAGAGKQPVRIFRVYQKGVRPPSFAVVTNEPDAIHFSYLRYLENRLRESFDFTGTPIRLIPEPKQ
ncbi:MAG: ribosome biogenesis GTPase Der [Firmicutes bacterium]|nr:ribosome biogenesis GTPase Der [Bacillota bacterium]